jgi:hypothetical protein
MGDCVYDYIDNILYVCIVLVICLILIKTCSEKKISETFADEEEKVKRAETVINSIGAAIKKTPDMSFDQAKSYLRDMNAVEYKDTKGMVKTGEPMTPQNLANKW